MNQGNLSVIVKNNIGQPVDGVAVTVTGPCFCKCCMTNSRGMVTFVCLRSGIYNIQASHATHRDAFATAMVAPSASNAANIKIYQAKDVYFALYYKKLGDDNAFGRAAETWLKEVSSRQGFNGGTAVKVNLPVSTEAEFLTAWNQVYMEGIKPGALVREGHLFTHSSKSDSQDGLEFLRDGADGTLTQSELSRLARLNWANDGVLVLHGCNTGYTGSRGWAPAQTLASSQVVHTVGQAGYSYFSKNPSTYDESTASSRPLYLWAFRRGKNGMLGDGASMPGVTFRVPGR